MRDSVFTLDSKTDEIRVSRNNAFNRLATWLRGQVAPNPLAATERDAAYNRFMLAMADHSGFDAGDVSRAEALLSAQILERKPLTSRHIREVLQDLEERSTEVERDNRITASYMSRQGVDMRLREQSAEMKLGAEDREMLAGRIGEAIHAAGANGCRKVDYAEATAITNGMVDELLAQKAASAQSEPQQDAEPERSNGTVNGAVAGRGDASGPVEIRAEVHYAPAAEASGRDSVAVTPVQVSPTELKRMVDGAGFPKELRRKVKDLVRSGEVTDEANLVQRANRRVADWVMENRVGTWYGDAQRSEGAIGRIAYGDVLMAPTSLLNRVERMIVESQRLQSWPDIKRQARALIAERVASDLRRQVN